jgi:drug/metabolite transporter (DMT)-like permease
MSPDSSFSIRRAEERAANHRASLHGDLFAVLAGASLGALLTTNRSAALHAPKANMKLASTFGSLLCVIFAIGLKVARGQADRFLPAAPFLALAFADGCLVSGFYICFVLAAPFVSAAEAGLIYLLTVVSPPPRPPLTPPPPPLTR